MMPRTSPATELSPTGFAVLAMFRRQADSAYGVTRQMKLNLHYLWPSAESHIYSEVARLEKSGLLAGRDEATGKRPRRIMQVTPLGEEALKRWLARPVAPGLSLQSESLLRLYFATLGDKSQLLDALASLQREADTMREVAVRVGEAYLAGEGVAPEQAHVRALVHELLGDLSVLLVGWSQRAQGLVDAWPDLSPQRKQAQAMRRFASTQKRIQASLVEPSAGSGA
ncbi:MAG: PadR family transcriptional regulator [Ramlibacter sp.]|nr:PadR family transcriptional regulator [Ramlibacter sp.]